MKLLNRYALLALGLSLTAALPSCQKDFLELKTTSAIADKDGEGSPKGLLGIVNGMHNMLYRYNFGQSFGFGAPSLNLRLDLMSDDVVNTVEVGRTSEYTYIASRDELGGEQINYKAWDFYYTVIQHANIFLRGYEQRLSPEDQKNPTVLYAKGEAQALRAYAYFQLVQLFAKRYDPATADKELGVILRTERDAVADLYQPIPRSTIAEIYKFIDQDLKTARELLKDLPQKEERNHLRYSTVCAIAARVALVKSDWAGAEALAKEAIEKSNSRLQVGNELLDGFNNFQASEWMWGYRNSETQQTYFNGFLAHYSYNFVGGWEDIFRYAINRSIYDEMGPNDVRRKWWYCYDLDQTLPPGADDGYLNITNGIPYFEITGQCVKYAVKDPKSSKGDVEIMRLGEMYYILAEAQARQNKTAEAQQTLYDVVKTRDTDFVKPTETGTALLDKIFLHKRIDLLFEGVRFLDMKRLGIVPNRLAAKNFELIRQFKGAGGGEDAYTKARKLNQDEAAQNIPTSVDSKFWQFKIPDQEFRGNPLCKQND